jgi:multicomponent Na+:H+ antiporter subunit G
VSVATVASAVLLAVGVLAALLSCVGMVAVRDTYDRLHFAGPANTIAPVAIAAAIVVRAGFGVAGVKAIAVAAVLVSTSAALTHATARAVRIYQTGRWVIGPDDGEPVADGPATPPRPPGGDAGAPA